MDLFHTEWKRKFSTTLYKDLKLRLAEMSFAKDFVNDRRGDLYPVLEKSDDCAETVTENCYRVMGGRVCRFVCQFFPYGTYELSAKHGGGAAGFVFRLPDAEARVILRDRELVFTCGDAEEKHPLPEYAWEECTLIVGCRPSALDVYFKRNGKPEHSVSFAAESFAESERYERFSGGGALLYVEGEVTVTAVESYLDSGVSLADMRSIRYENGEVMVEQGKIYLTASIRMWEEKFQGVFSWVPGTAEFELTGALFYDSGDGRWCGDVAASVLYHRAEKQWYLWVCSFAHDHVLGHAAFEGDPRFGVNVIDIELMEKAPEGAPIGEFLGFFGDEDPDFYYDETAGLWRMAICRKDPATRSYRYVFFESERPFEGYRVIGQGRDGAETGGSFVKINGAQYFICGNDFHAVSDYRIYHEGGMIRPSFDYPDGGFRGWGTLLPIRMGSRTRYFWLTFDRHGGSDWTWSYGNIYCFEAD